MDVPAFRDAWLQYCVLYNATRLAGLVREEDRTRPVTGGFNGA